MASNVYGTPVTNETLEGLPEFHEKTPTQQDRARVALEMKNAEGKDINARRFGEAIQQRNSGDKCSAIVFIYNATGNPLTFSKQYHWHGRVADSPIPSRIENGQWGVFVHGKADDSPKTARASVIYTGKAPNNEWYDWVLAWSTSADGPANQVTAQIGKWREFDDKWGELDTRLSARPLYDYRDLDGLRMYTTIANTTNTSVEAICTFYSLWYPD